MKISKIFHSLYAFLMFLPVCAVLGTTLYSILNPNAKDSYSGSTEFTLQDVVPLYNTETPSIIDGNYFDLQNNYAYKLVFSSHYFSGEDRSGNLLTDTGSDCSFLYDGLRRSGVVVLEYNSLSFDYFSYAYSNSTDTLTINTDDALDIPALSYDITDFVSNGDFFFCFVSNGDDIYYNPDELYSIVSCPLEYIPLTTRTIIHESETLDNAFSYSVNALYTNPLFSWCNNSFLTEPFHYIGDLFGLPRDNAINTLFSYWLNISIIWLCFDVIMYVPLLCHRWIDKGGLE